MYLQQQVTGRTGTEARIALAFQADALAIVDACGDGDFELFGDFDVAFAAAVGAGVFDYFTGSAAGVAGACLLEHTERGALRYPDGACAVAGGTGFGG